MTNSNNSVELATKQQKLEIHILLGVGVLFMLFGNSAANSSSLLGAAFYGATAFCFIVAAIKMFKNDIYTWR